MPSKGGAYIASLEPEDVASLKRMYEIVQATGAVKIPRPKAPSIRDRTIAEIK
jgi:hypothetical protein